MDLVDSKGTLQFKYETFEAKDAIRVVYEQKTLFDTGCVGTKGIKERLIDYEGSSKKINIHVSPNCLGNQPKTQWNFSIKCIDEKILALAAKQTTIKYLENAKIIQLRNLQRGKYFRIVADVYVDNQSLGSILVDKKLAVRYDGGKKVKDWCRYRMVPTMKRGI